LSNESTGPDSGTRLPRATLAPEGQRSSAISRPYRRRLSNYLLDKRLQLRYVGFVTILSAVLSGTLGYLIWLQEHQASSQILASVDTLCESGDSEACAEFRHDLDENLSRYDTSLVLIMGGVGVGLGVVLFLFMLVMTHKVAGPLYKVSTYFRRMSRGQLGPVYPLRKGDMLMEFYDKFQGMHEAVRAQFQRDADVMGRFLRACDEAGVARTEALGETLDALQSHHQARVRGLS
jgi:hypothetical protein